MKGYTQETTVPKKSKIDIQGLEKVCSIFSYASVFALALFMFTSFSASALHHIFLVVPGLYFFYKALTLKQINLNKSSYALIFLVVVSIVSVVFNVGNDPMAIEFPFKNIFKLKYFVISLLGIFAYRYWFENNFSEKKVKVVLNTFLVTTTLATASGLIALYTGFNPLKFKEACHATRTCGMYGMYMTYAYGIQFVVILLTGLWFQRKEVGKYLNIHLLSIALVVNFWGFYLSYARGALIAVMVALPFFFYKNNKKLFALGIVSILIVGSLGYTFVPKIQDVFKSDSRIYSIKRRVSLYQAAVRAAYERPILGMGYKNFEANSTTLKKKYNIPMVGFGGHGHSNFFEHLASTGVLGLIMLVAFHLFWLFESYKRKDAWGKILFPFVIVLILSGQFQYTLGDGENLFLIMLIYALSQVKPIKSSPK